MSVRSYRGLGWLHARGMGWNGSFASRCASDNFFMYSFARPVDVFRRERVLDFVCFRPILRSV